MISCPVTVDAFDLNGGVDGDGLDWQVQELKGWWDGTATFVDQQQRVVSHGQFGQVGHRAGRLVVVTGQVFARQRGRQSLLSSARERISALLADGGFGDFQTDDPAEGSRSASVQLLAGPEFGWIGGTENYPMDLPYQLQLLAPSPYKFGTTSSASTSLFFVPDGVGLVFPLFPPPGSLDFGSSGGVSAGVATVVNPGTADASVVFSVAGPTPAGGFTITDQASGKQIRWYGDVIPVGSEVTFDGRTGTVRINGTADRSGDARVERWPVVPAGGSADFLFATVGGDTTAAVLTVSCTATYW